MGIDIKDISNMTDEVLDGVMNGDFDEIDRIPDKYTYGHLMSMFYSRETLEGGEQIYKNLYTIACKCAESHIRQAAKERRIKIAFVTFSAAEWQAESLYRLLTADEAFETYIVVTPIEDRDPESCRTTYNETLTYYQEHGYAVRGGMDLSDGREKGWDEIGGIPDIVVHLSSWFDSVSKPLCLISLPLRCLNLYIPYGMETTESMDHTYMRSWVCNSVFSNMMWRIYEDTKMTVKEYKKYGLLQGRNVVYSGFPKMDYFYDNNEYTEEMIRLIWGMPEDMSVNDMRRVIIAPHHSVAPDQLLQFSTFRDNAFFLTDIVRKHEKDIFFVLKPHPNLRFMAVRSGIFSDYEAYDAYIASWEALPNAHVITESSYLDVFATSDAMIMDSCSFIGEYLYADKPLLFLTREGQAFTALGEKCMTAYETVQGTDKEGIERFLQETVLAKKDDKAGRRKRVFREELDYRNSNRRRAGEYIYRDLRALL